MAIDRKTKGLVVFSSMSGHERRLAEASAAGALEVPGVEVQRRLVPETLPGKVLRVMGALEAQQAMAGISLCAPDEPAGADARLW